MSRPTCECCAWLPTGSALRDPLARPQFNALLISVFAASALLLSSVGLYGVMATSVGQRRAEIGVRLALGATAATVGRMVLAEGLRLALVGVLAGLALALGVSRVLRGLLFEVEALDPVSLFGAAAVLIAAAALATYVPARSATRVDPIDVLRGD